MINDGLEDMDTIVKMLGRRICELARKSDQDRDCQLFILILLMGNKSGQGKKASVRVEAGHKEN